MLHLSDFLLCYFDFPTRKWISLTLTCRTESVPEVTPKVIKIFCPKAGKCCMGNHREEGKKEKRWTQALTNSSARPTPWKGASVGKAAAALGFTLSLECASIQPSLHLVSDLAFDDSAASPMPGDLANCLKKHCLPQTTLVSILCLLSGASSEMEHLRKSDPNSEEFTVPPVPPFQDNYTKIGIVCS